MPPGSEPWSGSVRPKQPTISPRRQAGQVLLALLFGAVGVDRVHDQGGLHRHGRAIAGIDPLHLARHQAVGDVVHPGAAVVLRQGRAEEAERPHFAEDLAVEALVPIGLEHPRHELLLAVVVGGVAHEPLVFAQLLVQQQGIVPGKDGPRDVGCNGTLSEF